MFHFPAYPPPHKGMVPTHDGWRVAPFGNPRINVLSATPRGLSRPHTSFIGTVCQGIHHTPFTTTHDTPPPHKTEGKGCLSVPANTLTKTKKQADQLTQNHQITKQANKPTQPHQPKTPEKAPRPIGHVRNIINSIANKSQHTTTPTNGGIIMLASTLQFSNHHTTDTTNQPTPGDSRQHGAGQPHPHTPQQAHTGRWRSGDPTACTTPPRDKPLTRSSILFLPARTPRKTRTVPRSKGIPFSHRQPAVHITP